MQDFIARENIKLYQRKLAETLDPDERGRLMELMDSEHERLRKLASASPPNIA